MAEVYRYNIVVSDEKKLNSLLTILQEKKYPVLHYSKENLTISTSWLPQAFIDAIKSMGCKIEGEFLEGEEEKTGTVLEFSEKLDVQVALACHAARDKDVRAMNLLVSTSTTKKKAEEYCPELTWQPYSGLGSLFLVNVSANEVLALVEKDWVKYIMAPRVMSLGMPR